MRIGVLLSRFPYPLEKGDKLRAFHQIRCLSENHEIFLCAISAKKVDQKAIDELQPYCKAIKIIHLSKASILINVLYGLVFSRLPLQVAYFFNRKAKKRIHRFFEASQIDHLYCQLIRVAEYVKDYEHAPKTLDYMDALSRGMVRRTESTPFYLKPFVKIEATRLKRYEHFIFSDFEHLTIISEQDRKFIIHAQNSKISIIRNGVDQHYFKPVENVVKEYELLFTGNMSYPPNVDCAEFLANEVMPLVWKKLPQAKLAIAGATPSARVKSLQADRIMITGWVDDMRKMYGSSKVFVAPMRIGSGLQNKLLEAMAMKLACITSPLANNALKAIDGKDILIADDATSVSQQAVRLLNDESYANTLATQGFQFISSNYDWKSSTTQLEALFLASNQNHGRIKAAD